MSYLHVTHKMTTIAKCDAVESVAGNRDHKTVQQKTNNKYIAIGNINGILI